MERLKEAIRRHGEYLGNGVLKIDAVINHQVDVGLGREAGEALAKRFVDANVTRVLTAETAGIVPAAMTALALVVPMVFARKKRPVTMSDPVWQETAPSHTKGGETPLMVAGEFIQSGDRVLIVDDFLASGATIAALARIVERAGASVVGVAALVEKTFEKGRIRLNGLGVPVVSLVAIAELSDDGTIRFAD